MFTSSRWCAEPTTQPCWLKVKVTVEGHKIEPLVLCQLHVSFTPGRIFIKLQSNVCLSEVMCRTYDSACCLKVKVTIEGHEFEPLISFPFHIHFTPGRIFIKLWLNVCLSEMMYRTHNSTMPTQGQGLNWRSWVGAFNFVPAPYLLYPHKDFHLNFGQTFASARTQY